MSASERSAAASRGRPTPAAAASRPSGGGGTSGTWTVLDLLRWTTGHFADRGIEGARLDAECLLAHALGVERLQLYLDFDKPVLPDERARFRELVRRRGGERVPVAQLTGGKEFWSLALRVTPDVLVPRPETETLVAAALECLPDPAAPARILELGTGSGAVALALASERPAATVVATDLSGPALKLAQENAERHGMADRIRLLEGDLWTPLGGPPGAAGGEAEGRDPAPGFDLIVSNPPYVAERGRAGLPPELGHEPAEALFAGEDGRAVLARIVAGASRWLAPGGHLALEHGADQGGWLAERCAAAGLRDVRSHRDLAGCPRVVTARGTGVAGPGGAPPGPEGG